jgi:hypothetical protein
MIIGITQTSCACVNARLLMNVWEADYVVSYYVESFARTKRVDTEDFEKTGMYSAHRDIAV